jgi:putative membrane protein
MNTEQNRNQKIIILLFFAAFIWSGIKPHDYFTWFLEVIPGAAGAIDLVLTYKKFRFTNFTYFNSLLNSFQGWSYNLCRRTFF